MFKRLLFTSFILIRPRQRFHAIKRAQQEVAVQRSSMKQELSISIIKGARVIIGCHGREGCWS